MSEKTDQEFMSIAIDLSAEALDDDVGGPFGAIVVGGGAVMGRGETGCWRTKIPRLTPRCLR